MKGAGNMRGGNRKRIGHIFERHAGIVLLTIFLVVVFALFYLSRNIILPFLVGMVAAYILLPVVSWIETWFPKRGRWMKARRILAIIIVFMLIVLVLGTGGYFLVTTTINSVTGIIQNAPDLISAAFDTILGWFDSLRGWLPVQASQQVDNFLSNLGGDLGNVFERLFTNITVLVPGTISFIMGFAALPIFLFYILKDYEHLGKRFYAWLPERAAGHVKKIFAIITEVLGGYLRAQLTMAVFVGVMALTGLLIIGAPFAVGLAIIAGITELVPILGPWIGGGVAVLIVLATEPTRVIWVIVLFLAIQLIENTLLVPRIQGHYMHVHPVVAIILIVAGASIAGFWGLILAVPLASTVVKVYEYIIRTAEEDDMEGDG